MAKIVLDAGHGGSNPGATYMGRREKDDVLQLAFDVGSVLERNGVDVEYTRVTDIYQSPFEKAAMANQSGADYFVSLHRNARDIPNMTSGVETLLYNTEPSIQRDMAENINQNLEELGFVNRGITARPNLVVLRDTDMPALLVEAGFIDSDIDNALYDANRAAIADGIAYGILEALQGDMQNSGMSMNFISNSSLGASNNMNMSLNGPTYRVQVGIFRNRENAQRMLNRLQMQGYMAYLILKNGLHYVQVGTYENFQEAVDAEQQLRRAGYPTLIVTN
ncbi:MAG: N-acetylmuramoyl-L-alanine amidase [Lachnospiraceae bacterium]|nr:N-acetylmuramoyl-L-alanine amidase [Lachnospiraceae bacterium]